MLETKAYFNAALRLVAGLIVGFGLFCPARANQTVVLTLGANYTLSVTANGTLPFTYQWYKDGSLIPGATAISYDINNAQAGAAGTYNVTVTNPYGTTTSDDAIISGVPVPLSPPVFLTHPASQSVNTGDNATFTATVNSSTPVTYQWQKDGALLLNGGSVSGATTATLTLTSVTSADIGNYALVATNSAGSVTSNAAAVLVVTTPPPANQAPIISVQPVSRSVFLGNSVTFAVVATALPAPIYEWRKGTATVTISASPTLTLNNVTTADAGDYSVIISNSEGTVTSSTATLTVVTNQPPTFTVQPVDQTGNSGSVIFISAQATGTPTPTYRWLKNGVGLTDTGNVTGSGTSTLTLTNVSSADAADYTVDASNSLGTTRSHVAKVIINGIPAFLVQPPGVTSVSSGAIVTMSVSVVGDPTPTLQWRKDNVNLTNSGIISGATSATLTLKGVATGDSGNYTVVATNSKGTITAGPFTLNVNPNNVWYQPVTSGKDTVIASPGATGNIKWQVSSSSGGGWTDLVNDGTYSGVNTDTLRIDNVTSALNSVSFRLVSINNGETTILKNAQLSVAEDFIPFPVGISADGAGNLYVADTSLDTITKINGAGQVITWAGASGQTGTSDGTGTAARFNNPSGVSSASDGSLVVTDNANATIRSVSPTGVVLTIAGSTTLRGNVNGAGTAATFSSPIGITRDSTGKYYVADSTNHTLRKIDTGAVVSTLAGSAGVSGSTNGAGSAARFNNLTRVATDLAGNLYVADTTNNLIRKVTPTGDVTTLAGLVGVSGTADGTGSNALFNQPGGVAVDNSGYVYVADTANSTIRRISPQGVVSTIGGLPGIAGHRDGVGTEAWFNQPRDLCIGNGFLFVADTGNAAIRKIAPDGSVTTLTLTALPGAADPITPLPLPPAPTLPAPAPTPTLPSSPTPVSTSSGGGGGGGAPSFWFCGAVGLLWLLRRRGQRF
ncbi:MAG TPA: immunoglobulin domain-containing protein [Lacunisphaera sp.]|nr:immunoglobulin domain-containing protein [Lacunisphaera sp.]